jgi:hypothetical protein
MSMCGGEGLRSSFFGLSPIMAGQRGSSFRGSWRDRMELSHDIAAAFEARKKVAKVAGFPRVQSSHPLLLPLSLDWTKRHV